MSGIIENLGNAVNSMFRGRTLQAQPSVTKVHTIPWGLEAFPDDGSGRSLHIKAGDTLHFVPIDDESHNVAEAEIVDEDEWLPARDRQLGISSRTRRGFNEQLKINKAGTYHLVCPVDGHHKMMRLTVVANGSNGSSPQRDQLSQQAKSQLDQAKQRAQQAVNEAKQRADEAHQAMAQAQQQQTEAAQQRAQQAMQKAQQAQQKAQTALQNLGNLAQQFGQNATQVVNDVTQGVQQGVNNVANQAMNLVTSLTNPMKKIGPLGPVNNHILESVQILQGTGTFASRFPNFDLSQFNILNQNRVVGPLGPVVRKRNGQSHPNGTAMQQAQNGSLPAAVMVDDMQDEEEIVAFGPAYDEQRRQSRRARRQQRDVAVRWDTNALLAPNGSVRTLEVPQGTVVTFHSTDGRPHNLVEVTPNFSTKKMKPMIDTEVTDELDETIQMDKVGTYYFISTTDPQTMRLIVKVNSRDDAADEIINGA